MMVRYNHQVSFDAVIDATVESFNVTAYIGKLSLFLDVPTDKITVVVEPASVRARTTIDTDDETQAATVSEALDTSSTDVSTATLSAALGVTVESAEPPRTEVVLVITEDPNSPDSDGFNQSAESLSTGSLIGIIAGSSLAVIALCIVGACILSSRPKSGPTYGSGISSTSAMTKGSKEDFDEV